MDEHSQFRVETVCLPKPFSRGHPGEFTGTHGMIWSSKPRSVSRSKAQGALEFWGLKAQAPHALGARMGTWSHERAVFSGLSSALTIASRSWPFANLIMFRAIGKWQIDWHMIRKNLLCYHNSPGKWLKHYLKHGLNHDWTKLSRPT